MTIGGVVSGVLRNIFRELDELEARYRRREVWNEDNAVDPQDRLVGNSSTNITLFRAVCAVCFGAEGAEESLRSRPLKPFNWLRKSSNCALKEVY